jgi:hypothetical protein
MLNPRITAGTHPLRDIRTRALYSYRSLLGPILVARYLDYALGVRLLEADQANY